jgi:NADH:ubiquinone oxidoreductase subunit 4 (subunit M)
VWRKYSKVTAIYYVSMLSLYLVRFAGSQPLLGTARYVLMLFPAFFVLAEWGRRPWANRLILYSSFAGLLFLSGQFAIWGWVG